MEVVERVVTPLHRLNSYITFAPQLVYLCSQVVSRQPSLLPPLLRSLLHCWPRSNSEKEVLFLEEVEELLGVVELPANLLEPLLRQLCLCCSSLHARVAERSLRLLTRHRLLLEREPELTRKFLLPALLKNITSHWSRVVVVASEVASEVVLEVLGSHGRGEVTLRVDGGAGDFRRSEKGERSPKRDRLLFDKGALAQRGRRIYGRGNRKKTELENGEVEAVNRECKVKASMKEEGAVCEGWRAEGDSLAPDERAEGSRLLH